MPIFNIRYYEVVKQTVFGVSIEQSCAERRRRRGARDFRAAGGGKFARRPEPALEAEKN